MSEGARRQRRTCEAANGNFAVSRKVAADLVEAASAMGMQVVLGEPLAKHTTFRIGGPADLYAAAASLRELDGLTALATERGMPVTILGGGSNVLVSDAGVRGLVIANQTRRFGPGSEFPDLGDLADTSAPSLIAESGVLLAGLARWAIRQGWAGLEWAVSVPGTLGGAVVGNAGAHGSDIASSLLWVLLSHAGRGARCYQVKELGFGYRSSLLKQELAADGPLPIVLAAGLRMVPGDVAEMSARAEGYLARRRRSQPVEPSAGSVFRNPPGEYAGRLIEAVGLKGHRIGGAQVSPQHANFIVNVGGAKAADVAALMDLIRSRVHEEAGHRLEPEIRLLGEWPRDAS